MLDYYVDSLPLLASSFTDTVRTYLLVGISVYFDATRVFKETISNETTHDFVW